MEYTYQYSWIISFIPLPIPILIGVGLLLFPTSTKNLRHMWSFPSILLLSIVMLFRLIYLFNKLIEVLHINMYGLGPSLMIYLLSSATLL
uniref:NADH-plastoquinone oxidoreductase subunit 5 n=1 Tax=Wikstroemia indica TaxID=714517 RepID=A0A8K1X2P6_9ROSI|nr:NADH-plastoquinone oxidoreductase subunit 5 [Wikstroemia indica]